MNLDQRYIRTSLNEEEDTLITSHFLEDVLTETDYYKDYDLQPFLDFIDNPEDPLIEKLKRSKKANERQIEEFLIIPTLKSLGNKLEPQSVIEGEFVDFCLYDSNDKTFDPNFKNTTAALEAKRYGRIENNYYIKQKNNSDEIYQPFQYLKNINTHLSSKNADKTVDFIILTDGYLWRIYSRNFTYSDKEFQDHFLEFNLEEILKIKDKNLRNSYLKKFAVLFSEDSFKGKLSDFQQHSSEIQKSVTTELKEQTFTALEYIATGLWREIFNPNNLAVTMGLSNLYGININEVKNNEDLKRKLLRIIYDESVVFLLRVLFILFAEDRKLFDTSIPTVIKGKNGILNNIVKNSNEIGSIQKDITPSRDDDADLKQLFNKIDEKYNGGLFSAQLHQLIQALNLDDALFFNAIDNLCRVKVKNKIYTVDFSTISAREIGSIYESLLEYKLAEATEDIDEMESILNKNRIRKNIKKGDLYLINQKGERKSTGSYYTDDLIVEHLVNTTLEPKLHQIKKEIIENDKSFIDLLKQVLELKICDPAMGSGHFLLGAYSRLISFLRETLEEFNENGIETELKWNEKLAYEIRSLVARRCIYGVDLNENAVEIAKLILWMKVFRSDKPFEFFDTNLVCGNSLIGINEDIGDVKTEGQMAFFESKEKIESRIQKVLLERVEEMMQMPRDTKEGIEEIKTFYETKIDPLQKQISFMLNLELAEYLVPEKSDLVNRALTPLVKGIDQDENYVQKIFDGSSEIPEEIKELKEINEQIIDEYNPLHWRAVFPHIFVNGGFDIVLSNPPWDAVKPYWHEFLAEYRDQFPDLIGQSERLAKKKVFKEEPELKRDWDRYERYYLKENQLFNKTYKHQIIKGNKNKIIKKGDNNLFKLFTERIYSILRPSGLSGIVIPNNFNLDSGTTALRKLLLEKANIKELIMFENKLGVFKDVHRQYKFDVLTFEKKKPRKNSTFKAGFYWYDPIWLDNNPDKEYQLTDQRRLKENHRLFNYPLNDLKNSDPDNLTIQEFKDKKYLKIYNKLSQFPEIGDPTQDLYIKTYNDFHMTNDKDLFQKEEIGWPLYEGKMIHFFTNSFSNPQYFINQEKGEKRLTTRNKIWKKHKEETDKFLSREYRIAWRNISNPTNERTIISTIIPRGSFTGNSLYLIEIILDSKICLNYDYISGLNTVLSSFTADFLIRNRVSLNVSSSFLKELPVPRNLDKIKSIGKMALPLYTEEEMDDFRNGIKPITEPKKRDHLRAKLDAEVAHLYGLTYEEYVQILQTFPLVDETYKKKCINEFNKILFESN